MRGSPLKITFDTYFHNEGDPANNYICKISEFFYFGTTLFSSAIVVNNMNPNNCPFALEYSVDAYPYFLWMKSGIEARGMGIIHDFSITLSVV